MGSRKNRSDKYGVGILNSIERAYLAYIFMECHNTSVWISEENDAVHGADEVGYKRGHLIRSLATKGYLLRQEVQGKPDWTPEERIQYVLTAKGQEECPSSAPLPPEEV
jgi:hypothetical protein